MASGLPDYDRVTRPMYGAAQCAGAAKVVTANVQTQLVLVSGKGVIYGGTLFVIGTSGQRLSIPIIKLDAQQLSWGDFMGLNDISADRERSEPFYLLKYDNVNFIYCVGLSRNLTFETSFETIYDEKHGTTPIVSCRVVYALI